MSRRIPNHQLRYARHDNNPYKVTTLPLSTNHPPQKLCPRRGGNYPPPQTTTTTTTIDVGFSDATTTDTYNDYGDQNVFRHGRGGATDVSFSDDSGSTRLPYFEFDDESLHAHSRNSFSEHGSCRQTTARRQGGREVGRTVPEENEEEPWEERLYHEIQTPCDIIPAPQSNVSARRVPQSRMSDRPQSSMSSALTNAMVHGCGGKCQTFENICYFVLQLVFTMGIFMGVSLCIAGLVLRKSAASNLQVLVYIGIMIALVSGLLLLVQCRAKNTAKRRVKAIQMAKRAPIQMEPLNIRTNPVHSFQRQISIRETQRSMHVPEVHNSMQRPLPQRPRRLSHNNSLEEEQGIPWWRRKEEII